MGKYVAFSLKEAFKIGQVRTNSNNGTNCGTR